jgi:hypothetical protein
MRHATGLGESIEVQMIPNPDVALETFRAGAGDLFFGGLPQRLALQSGDFKEVAVCGKEFPLLSSLHSLICSERMFLEKRPLLHAVDALWFETCRRLYLDAEFRTLVFAEIGDLLERHGVEKHSLVRADFEKLFTPAGRSLEIFAQFPAELWDEGLHLPANP